MFRHESCGGVAVVSQKVQEVKYNYPVFEYHKEKHTKRFCFVIVAEQRGDSFNNTSSFNLTQIIEDTARYFKAR